MGTGASSYTPPPTPFRSVRSSNLGHGFDDNMSIFEGTMMRTNNSVAPVIIKNCMEEYQHITDLTEPFVYGSLNDKLPQHLLIQGEYFLVRDHQLLDGLKDPGQEMQQVQGGLPVYRCAQPTANELRAMIQKLADQYSEILLFNMREEPVLFVHQDKDFIPYSIKSRDNLKQCIITGKIVKEADLYEASIRRQVIALATMNDENKFCFYNNTETFTREPHVYPVEFEDNLLVAEEVYSRLAFSNHKLRYRRLCFPLDAAPPDLEVDHFISITQDSELSTNRTSQPAMLFTCHSGTGRSALGAVMGCLLQTCKDHHHTKRASVSTKMSEKENPMDSKEEGYFRAIRKLVEVLPQGKEIKAQVDEAIDRCSAQNFRRDIMEAQTKLHAMQSAEQTTAEEIQGQYQRCVNYLSRYFFLISFNAYLWEQYDSRFRIGFTKWMSRHPEVSHVRSNMNLPVYGASLELLTNCQHCLVADNYIGLDLLGSQMDERVPNFHKINIKYIPVFGMAQPTNDGLSKVVNHLLNTKIKHTHVVVVNLRNDIMVEIDDTTYSLRDVTKKDEPIIFPGFSRTEIEDQEEALKKMVRHKTFTLHNDLCDPPVEHDISNAYTVLDVAENQRLQTLDMTYYRVPLLSEMAPSESDIDRLMETVCGHCRQERLKNHRDPAFVFFCRTGKSRTTFAMAVAGLVLCHIKGFPRGSRQGEQERISCPNAQYTKGEFIIVQKLVRMLPEGHQVKREVDFILDEIFNTMTPMMFHMREIIFVTYNKIKKCSTDWEREMLRCQSVLYLERYIYLILFNAYLHHDAATQWKRPFSGWMREVGGRAGVYELLDNLGFYDLDDSLSSVIKMSIRWKCHIPNVLWQGEFV